MLKVFISFSLIVGGHSHTPLGNLTDVETSAGDYPTIETNLDGDEVFVVTAYVSAECEACFAYSGTPCTQLPMGICTWRKLSDTHSARN